MGFLSIKSCQNTSGSHWVVLGTQTCQIHVVVFLKRESRAHKFEMCIVQNEPTMPTRVTSQQNEMLSFGGRTVHVDNIVRLIEFLRDGNVFTEDMADTYWNALHDHFHFGILPGDQRFPMPAPAPDMYFLPALTFLFDNYTDPPETYEAMRIEFSEDDTTQLSSLDGEDLFDPDDVIDQCLLDAVELEFDDIYNDIQRDARTI